MAAVGIIAEYNPFHNGHLHQLRALRRRFPGAGVVVAMSGSFVQRGTAAVLDKWQRARAAVECGASLVVELPTVFATQSAERFAMGGVRLLDRLGIADTLAFGAETADLGLLRRLARADAADGAAAALRERLRTGASYAAARAALPEAAGLLREPNVILAVEYLRAIERTGAALAPLPLARRAAGHHDAALPAEGEPAIASASAIRAALFPNGQKSGAETVCPAAALRAVPPVVRAMLRDALAHGAPDPARLLRPILARLFVTPAPALRQIAGCGEGLEHRLLAAALRARSYEALVNAVSTKRYPRARIRRLLLHLLLDLGEETARRFREAGPLYARVLAMDDAGRRLLREAKARAALPIVTKPADFLSPYALKQGRLSPAQAMLSFDLRASALRSLAAAPDGAPPANADFLTPPFCLRRDVS